MADPANPEGYTSRLGRARRVSSAGVARRAAVRQTRAKASAVFASQIRSSLLESERGARTDGRLSRLSPAH
jgi:hypothetical protein